MGRIWLKRIFGDFQGQPGLNITNRRRCTMSMVSSFLRALKNRNDCPILCSHYLHRQRKQSKVPTTKIYRQILVSTRSGLDYFIVLAYLFAFAMYLSAKALIGQSLYNQISATAVTLFKEASSHALSRGLILADTKFEFGLISTEPDSPQQLILIDEVLTPDSSRYWPSDCYQVGKPQPSFDKQFLRDWLTGAGFKKGLEKGVDGQGWLIEEAIMKKTKTKYEEAVRMLTS
jgi:hypothetical protein